MFKGLFGKIDKLFTRGKEVTDELFDELEEQMILADVSMETTLKITESLRQAVRKNKIKTAEEVKEELQRELTEVLSQGNGNCRLRIAPESPTVYLFVGVNGTGKTTTVGKLAYRLKNQGKKVLIVAADTFRAAAIDQLEVWANRAGVEIIRGKEGSDPGAVVFDSIQAARARHTDYLIIDTAGRLHTKANLMEEVKKIARIVERELGRSPEETILVVDATTGQNAVLQAQQFGEAAGVTAVVLSKLDGTAKGGIVITIKEELGYPIKLIGVGEKAEDLQDFDANQFVSSLFEES